MSRKLFAIVLGCALLAPVVASAHYTTCSLGFWKTHEEVWVDQNLPRCESILGLPARPDCCAQNIDFDQLIADLNLGGACPDGNCPRQEAADFLNSCFLIETAPFACDD
jgi:hypothetical protein